MIIPIQRLILLFAAVLFAACSNMASKPGLETPRSGQSLDLKPSSTPMLAKPAPAEPQVETKVSPAMLYQLMVAEVAAQRGQLDIAIDNYLEVATATRDPKAAARAVQIASYAQSVEKALTAVNLWVSIQPDNADARRMSAILLLKAGRTAEVVPQYEKMIEILEAKGHLKGAYLKIADQLAREQNRSIALTVMEKLVAKYSDNANALYAYAHLAMRQAQFDTALSNLSKILEIRPNWSDAVILKARILALKDGRDKALAYLSKILKGNLADDVETGLTYARMLTEARKLDEALKEFSRLAELDPQYINIQYFAGVLALQLRKLDQSQKYLERLSKSGNRRLEANYYLGQIAELKEDPDTAINRYSQVKSGEQYFNAQIRVAALLADKGLFDHAREHLHTIRINSNKQQLQIYLLEGDLLREALRLPEALEHFTDVLEAAPNETSIRYARALVAEKLGKLSLLESDLQQILEIEPKNAQVLNALGYTLADRTNRYEEALKYIKTALELEPNDAAVMDSMGWVQYRLGNYNVAIDHLSKANDIAKDPEIAAHLGEVLWVSGNRSAALEIWEGSLKDNPKSALLLGVMKRFGL